MSIASKGSKIFGFALTAALLVVAMAQGEPLVITEGYNFLTTPTTPASFTTLVLPAGFFGEKNGIPSDPIMGQVVTLIGRPTGALGLQPRSSVMVEAGNCHSEGGHHHCHEDAEVDAGIDTITKIGGAVIDNLGETAVVELEIVAVSLQTPDTAPVKVTYGKEPPSFFRMILTLDYSVPQEVGSIVFVRTAEAGGIMEVTMPVHFQVLFTGEGSERFGPVSLNAVLQSINNGFTVRNIEQPAGNLAESH